MECTWFTLQSSCDSGRLCKQESDYQLMFSVKVYIPLENVSSARFPNGSLASGQCNTCTYAAMSHEHSNTKKIQLLILGDRMKQLDVAQDLFVYLAVFPLCI